jgi:hypothetical protein
MIGDDGGGTTWRTGSRQNSERPRWHPACSLARPYRGFDVRNELGIVLGVFLLVGCGGATNEGPDGGGDGGSSSSSGGGSSSGGSGGGSSSSSGSSGGSSSGGSSSDSGGTPSIADSGGGSSSGADAGGRVPVNHRPNDDQCAGPAPAGNCMGGDGTLGGSFMCLEDSDCTAGPNGRCGNPGGPAGCSCSYDACTQDTDCPSGKTCACHGSPFSAVGNTCVAGNCRVDADCGAGGYCSPTAPSDGVCGNVAGYYCHTPNDLCLNDSDCVDAGGGPGGSFCEYSTTNSRWECARIAECL